jgi:predicted NBD/HSP70 family sugar kinase
MGEHRGREVMDRPGEEVLIQRVQKSIEMAMQDADVEREEILALGVALPGQIDIDSGAILFAPLLGLTAFPFPFAAQLHDYFAEQYIALINNDDAPTIGEQRIGEGKDFQDQDLVYLRIGYNIGAGIIIQGKLYMGVHNLAGAFGHLSVDLNGPVCICGNRGCLDTLVSREAIARQILQSYQDGTSTMLADWLNKEPIDINSALLAEAVDQEDALTCRIVDGAAEILGVGIANVINILNPRRVILGGDVIDEIDLFFEKAVASAHHKALSSSLKDVSIVRGGLRTTAAAYGAAVFAREHLHSSKLFHPITSEQDQAES